MIPLEDKLRAAIHATAQEIPADPPPLRLDSPARSPRRRPWSRPARRRRNPWLAPLAAAALVVAVVLGSLAVTRSESGTATPATPAGNVPPYYVALIPVTDKYRDAGGSETEGIDAQVRSTATGAVLATIAPPKPYHVFSGISATADNRTFVLIATDGDVQSPQRLFVLRLNPEAPGSRVSLRAASVLPADESDRVMALSPDGTALATETQSSDGTLRVNVYNLVTGARRTWSFTIPSGSGEHYVYVAAVIDGLSWTADGQHVAFTGPGASADSFALRLLDTSNPGTNALTASYPIPPPAVLTQAGSTWMGAIITPDGRTAVYTQILTTHNGGKTQSRQQFVKVSVATGQVTAILPTPKSLAGKNLGAGQILYTNATGSMLVVSYFPRAIAGILRGDTYTSIPWTAYAPDAAW